MEGKFSETGNSEISTSNLESERPVAGIEQPFSDEMSSIDDVSFQDSERPGDELPQWQGDVPEASGNLMADPENPDPDLCDSEASVEDVKEIPTETETNAENIEKQDKEIARVESGEKSLDTTQEKGNYGEMKTDQDLRNRGFERISKTIVTDIDSPGHQGTDGIYKNQNPDGVPKYIIVDAKYGTAQLSDTMDGKQMSSEWTDKRLDGDVGPEIADEIRMEKLLNPDNVGSYVAHVEGSGDVKYDKLDDEANVVEKDVEINAQG